MPQVVLIDNYDSFTHNLARYFELMACNTHIVRNDATTLSAIEALAPQAIVISPGPRTPKEAGISLETITYFAGKVPILGICLGHQAIAVAFGASISHAKRPMHGSSANIHHQQQGIFSGIQTPLSVGRYHSLVIDPESVPDCLMITAYSPENEIMAIQHRKLPIIGLQFHPESVLTHNGLLLIENFLN